MSISTHFFSYGGSGGGGAVPEYAPLDANARLSIGFPAYNYDATYQSAVHGPKLTNVFGNTTTGAAGALAIRVRHRPGTHAANAVATGQTNTAQTVFSSGSLTAARSHGLWYNPPVYTPAFAHRYFWRLRDHPGTGIVGASTIGGQTVLVGPALDVNARGEYEAVHVVRRGAGGQFDALAVQPGDTAVRAGESHTPATWVGNALPTADTFFGAAPSSGSALPITGLTANFFQNGEMCDFVQLDGTGGTDAEWLRFSNGEDPATIWGASLAAHYRLGGTDDLTKTAGSRGYGAAVIEFNSGGSNCLEKASNLRPTPGTVTAANNIYGRGRGWRALTGIDSADVRAVYAAGTGAAGLASKSATVYVPIVIGGAATHVEARAVRESDGLVVVPWGRRTSSAVTGKQTIQIPAVPVGDNIMIDVRREDDPTCVHRMRNRSAVGVAAVWGLGQSQMFIGATSPASPVTPSAAARNVRFGISRRGGTGLYFLPYVASMLDSPNNASGGIILAAARWTEKYPGIPLSIDVCAWPTYGIQQWVQNEAPDGGNMPLWGDGVTIGSGRMTDVMLATNKQISVFISSWWTADSGASGTWPARANEIYGGVAAADSDFITAPTVAFASRKSLAKESLAYRPYMAVIPVARDSNSAYDESIAAGRSTYRKSQADWGSGTGRASTVDAVNAGWSQGTVMDATSSPHQNETINQGNVRFVLDHMMALERACGLITVDSPTLSFTSRVADRITLQVNRVVAGTIELLGSGASPAEFWVKEGVAAWTRALSAGTVTLSGADIRLDKAGAVPWVPGTLVRYNSGFPAAGTGTLAGDRALIDGMLCETWAGADFAARPVDIKAALQVAPTLVDLVAT